MAVVVAIDAYFMRRLALQSRIINFRGYIGYSDLYVKVNGRTHMKIIIEALPSKSRTYLAAEINNKKSNSYTEFTAY